MSGSSLLGAVAIGTTIGLVGRLVLPGPKAASVWLTIALGVAAAHLGTIGLGLIGVEPDAWVARSVAQVCLAVPVVVLTVVAAGRVLPQEGAARKANRATGGTSRTASREP
ncbi:hypothetical protein [Micromonospora sp. NPDC050495]|uniref:hypothetical protein n=1 Tax=Micromonospora sp. NPDC050495 TaxID=3154936 RepID=UPI0033D683E7